MAPVYNYETEIQEAIRPIITKAKAKYDLEGEEIKALKKTARSTKKSDERQKIHDEIIAIMTNRTVIPTEPKLTVSDVTPEKVNEILAQNNGRIAVIDSEGSGVIDIFAGRYAKKGVNIDVYLKGYSGGERTHAERMSRASSAVKNPAITTILTIQPEVMNTLAKNKVFRRRGLLGRFLYSIPESLIGSREYKNISINEDIKTAYNVLIKSIFLIPEPDQQPYSLIITDEALDVWTAYYDDIERKQKRGSIFDL